MIVIGHRGARGHAPENTLASLELAIDMQADMIEFDVYSLRTGEVVLMHDHRVDRTTNGQGRIMQQHFRDLRALQAGEYGNEPQQVPTLEEALDLIKGRVAVNIELKGPETALRVAEIVHRYLETPYWEPRHFVVSSFDHHELRAFKMYMPNVPVAALEHTIPLDYAANAERLQAMAVNPNHEFLNQTFVDDAHRRGLKVYTYTVNEPDDIEDLLRMGVDGIFTDYPQRAKAVIAAFGKRNKNQAAHQSSASQASAAHHES